MTVLPPVGSKPPINLAVLGCGNMASNLVRHAIALGRARIAAIYDPNPETLAARCAEFGAQPETELRAIAQRADVDAFLIGSPPLYHHQNVMAVAPAGKPIYSEKPLCTTVALCTEMIETCRQHGAKLFVGQVLRLIPLFWKSHQVLESGAIGTPQVISVTRTGFGAGIFRSIWRLNLRESGGILLEINSHELDYMLFLMGEAESVYAQGRNVMGQTDYDDAVFVQIRFKNGGIGMLHSSLSSPLGEYRVHIQGSEGNLLHGGFGGELRYQRFDATEPTVFTRDDLADIPNATDWELTSFFDWCQDDLPPLFTGETGRANVAVAEAAYRSLASGKPEPVVI